MGVDFKEIQKLITLCRKNGVAEIEAGGLKLKLFPGHRPKLRKSNSSDRIDSSLGVTEEQALFWSSPEMN